MAMMSDPFDWRTEARRRLALRAKIILPSGNVAALLEDDAQPKETDLLQWARPEGAPPAPGFQKIASMPWRRPEPLHEVVSKFSPALGRHFASGGLFHHVGGRPCFRRVPGFNEETWLRTGVGLEGEVRPATASAGALAWITVGGIGFLPVVGATLASLVTALVGGVAGAVWDWDWEWVRFGALAVAGISTLASLLVERASERHFLSDDAREFVLDEVAGMALTLAFVPAASWPWGVVLAFCAFRFFDVLKPGIDWVEERHWRGTIVWDDLLAGLYAGLCTGGLALGILYLVG
jgi:phosphatidylglycerophosphatase A